MAKLGLFAIRRGKQRLTDPFFTAGLAALLSGLCAAGAIVAISAGRKDVASAPLLLPFFAGFALLCVGLYRSWLWEKHLSDEKAKDQDTSGRGQA